jgi:Collagen triple helix repeat (20 copies)
MTDATTAAAEVDKPMSASDIASLNATLAARLRKDRIGVRPAKTTAERPRQRRPLGLRPIADDVAAHEARPAASEAEFENPVVALIVESNALLVDLIDRQREHFERKVVGLETAHAKLINENTALRLILENLRITQRGERGVDGDRGAPGAAGRDGLQGPIGPKGEPGPRGLDAPKIVSFEVDDAAFVAYPLLSTGHKGPGLHLRGMFEAYNEQVDASDAAAEIDAAARSREVIEQEAANVRAGLPAR